VLTDILHLVQIEMYHTALAFRVRIGLTFYRRTAAFTWYDFVLGHFGWC
jgi:hypothetical protein